MGLQASALHTFETSTTQYSVGPSVGYNPFKNVWASIGYNVQGFQGAEFNGADYTAQSPYLKLRFKVDQQSLKELLDYASFDR